MGPPRKENRDEWNSRIQGGIPHYDPMKDKNCFTYQSSVGAQRRVPSAPRVRPGEGRRPLRPISPRTKEQPHRRPMMSEKRYLLEDLKAHIEESWISFEVPEFHRKLFAKKFFSTSTAPADLVHEAQRLATMAAPVQRVMRLCDDRELLLKRMETFARILRDKQERFSREMELQELSDLLNELREVSLQLVSAIVKWRQQVAPPFNKLMMKTAEHPVWWHGEVNYLLKMKNDTHWASESALNSIVEFSGKFDPFFVYPSLKVTFPSDMKSKARLRNAMRPYIPLANWELQRVKKAEDVILIEVCERFCANDIRPNTTAACTSEPIVNFGISPSPVAPTSTAQRSQAAQAEPVSPEKTRVVAPDVQELTGRAPSGPSELPADVLEVTPITLTAAELETKLSTMGFSSRLQESLEAPNFDAPNEWYWVGNIGVFAFKLKKGMPAACLITYVAAAFENLPKVVAAIKKYVFTNVASGCIRMTLWYIGDEDNFHLDTEIEDVLKEHKFKWFTLTNTLDRRRGQVYTCRRSNDDPIMPDSQSCIRLQIHTVPSVVATTNSVNGSGLVASGVIRTCGLEGSNAKPSRVISLIPQLPERIPATRIKSLTTETFDDFFEVFQEHAPKIPMCLPGSLPCGALAVELEWPADTILQWASDAFTIKTQMVGYSKSAESPVIYCATDDEDIFVVIIPFTNKDSAYDFATRALVDCEESTSSYDAVRLRCVQQHSETCVGPLKRPDDEQKFMLSEKARITINAGRQAFTLPSGDVETGQEVLDLTSRPYLLCIQHAACELPLHVIAV